MTKYSGSLEFGCPTCASGASFAVGIEDTWRLMNSEILVKNADFKDFCFGVYESEIL